MMLSAKIDIKIGQCLTEVFKKLHRHSFLRHSVYCCKPT